MNRIAQILNGQIHWVFETEDSLEQVRGRFAAELIFEDITHTEYQEGWVWDSKKRKAIAPFITKTSEIISFDYANPELTPEDLKTLTENEQSTRVTVFNKSGGIVTVIEGDQLPELLEQLRETNGVDELIQISSDQQLPDCGAVRSELSRLISSKLNIATVTDEQYMVPTTVALLSILEHTKASVDFYVIESEVSDAKKAMLRKALTKRADCTVTFISIPAELFAKIADMKMHYQTHVNKLAYVKLLLQYLLADLSKVLYIDGDMLVMEDISGFYNVDLSDYYGAAVHDTGGDVNNSSRGHLGLSGTGTYFNTGLMLLNLAKWREDEIFNQFREWYDQKNHVMLLHDQEVINGVLADQVLIMDDHWNIQQSNRRDFLMENSNAVLLKKGIYHFTGPYKPWREVFNKFASPTERQIFRGLYSYYLSQVEVPEEDSGPITVVGVTDDGYVRPYLVAFMSLLENTNEPVNIFVMDFKISEANRQLMRERLETYANCTLTFMTVPDNVMEEINHFKDHRHTHMTNISYGRLYIPDLFKDYRKVLYVDGDVMFVGDVKELWDINVSGYYAGATPDIYNKVRATKLGLNEFLDYFNAGVLLFNIAAFAYSDFIIKCQKWCQQNYDLMTMADQDILNGVFNGGWKDIGATWNAPYCDGGDRTASDLLSKANLIHFLTEKKPWTDAYADQDDVQIETYRRYLEKIRED